MPLLFAYDKSRFCHDMAHFNMSTKQQSVLRDMGIVSILLDQPLHKISEPEHDKTNKMTCGSAKTKISLCICPV